MLFCYDSLNALARTPRVHWPRLRPASTSCQSRSRPSPATDAVSRPTWPLLGPRPRRRSAHVARPRTALTAFSSRSTGCWRSCVASRTTTRTPRASASSWRLRSERSACVLRRPSRSRSARESVSLPSCSRGSVPAVFVRCIFDLTPREATTTM
jgi:hypothetical protein